MLDRALVVGLLSVAMMYPNASRAGGTAVTDLSPRAASLQGAFTAIADNPSAVFYNPAGLTQVPGTQLEVNSVYVVPDIDYQVPGLGSAEMDRRALGVSMFGSTDTLEWINLGIGLYSPFARDAKYSADPALLGFSQQGTLLRLDLTPTVAFELSPRLSVGFGVVASRINLHSSVFGFEEKGRGYGFTGNAGVLFKATPQLSVGVAYRGEMAARIEGRGKLMGLGGHFNAKLRFPATLSTGITWRPDSRLLLSVGYDLERWSYLDSFRRSYDNPVLNALGTNVLDGDDSYVVRLGMEWKPREGHELRLGYSRLNAAVPARNTLPGQPDPDIQTFSVGYARDLGKLRFDLSYERVLSEEQRIGSVFFPGAYEIDAQVLSFGVSYRWDAD